MNGHLGRLLCLTLGHECYKLLSCFMLNFYIPGAQIDMDRWLLLLALLSIYIVTLVVSLF